MRIPRLYIPQPLARGETLNISGQPAHHVIHVLRMRTGSALTLFNGNGSEYRAILNTLGRSEITVTIDEPSAGIGESVLDITLVQGIARNDRMDLILQKAIELGVRAIQPVWMERSQTRIKGTRLEKRMHHWRGITTSACEQCGRNILPSLLPPLDLPHWLGALPAGGRRLLLQPESDLNLRQLTGPEGAILLLVGPEGGLSTAEHMLAEQAGFLGIRLGPRILRTETAAIAALAGMQTLWGDFAPDP